MPITPGTRHYLETESWRAALVFCLLLAKPNALKRFVADGVILVAESENGGPRGPRQSPLSPHKPLQGQSPAASEHQARFKPGPTLPAGPGLEPAASPQVPAPEDLALRRGLLRAGALGRWRGAFGEGRLGSGLVEKWSGAARKREGDKDTEDASETDLAKHEEEDFVEMKEQMYQDKLASLKRQLQQLQEGTLQEYQKRMKKLDQQYKERIRNAELFLQLETDQVEKNYVKEKKAAAKEFEDKKIELKENLIAELEEKKKMIENEKLTMELTGDSMEVKPIMTRKLRRRPNDPVPIPDKRRKPAPAQLNYLLTDEQIMEDLRTLNKLKSPKRPASPSSPEHLPATPAESPAQRFEARIEDGKLYYDKRWYHKSQAIYLESKENTKISCVISSVGANEIWVRKTSDSTKMRIYLGQLQRGVFVIRRRSAA
ncbi:PREDICTED: sin3 histone deacetylase corepressor complex component SDS3 [Nipponia nippon]|uniref:sin3 histone deacetylase corepressor complex component SDS3 n=1 Tax=Nipponia nippon TaxID=128390 RepID=UPI00051134BC|nr:PREDICTED: sin3 histone deacetylase corepressor complex component SDS3 [Nipponia nippon]